MHPDWQRFLESHGARIADGEVRDFGDTLAETAALDKRIVLCDLSHEGLILASGDDANAFLHGQLTNDVAQLQDGRVQWNGYCTPKGRLLASFLMWPAKQGLLLQMPVAMVEPIRKRLSMFVLRAKVKLEDVSQQWARIGIAGSGAAKLLQQQLGSLPPAAMQSLHLEGLRIIRLGAEQFEVIGTFPVIEKLWTDLAPHCVPAGRQAWDWHMIQSGIAVITPKTQESFVPQMVNFDLTGAVNFKKGCYPGQEIVARTQYRGILKRRMALAKVNATEPPQPGDAAFSPVFGDQAAGEVVQAAPAPHGGYDLLVVAQVESLRDGRLHLRALDGPALTLKPLPYPLPLPEPA